MKREKERSQIENSGKRSFSRLLFIRVPSEGWSENRLDENVMINERENNSIVGHSRCLHADTYRLTACRRRLPLLAVAYEKLPRGRNDRKRFWVAIVATIKDPV